MDIIKFKNNLIDMELNNINKDELGFIKYDCYTFIYRHLVCCLENNKLFDKHEKSNINNFINKIRSENSCI